jgi:hypothetical protein
MAFEIHLTAELYSVLDGIGAVVTVNNLTVSNGFVSVGSYHVPLDQILFIKEV